ATMGIPLLRGRQFHSGEGATAILDQAAVSRLWPDGNGIGQHIRIYGGNAQKPRDAEVVGIVANIQDHLIGRDAEGHLYLPFGPEYQANMTVQLRIAPQSREAETRLLESLRREIRAVDGRVPVLALRTMRDHLDRSADIWLVGTGGRMFGIFGAVALA